jgi:nucleoside-diphosphate-sugar epimerase
MNYPNIEVFVGDLGDPEAVSRAMAGIELVYHVGAAMSGASHEYERGTIAGTRNVVESALRNGTRVVYISSLSCLDASRAGKGAFVNEDWPIEPFPAKRGFYTQAKTEAEKTVLDAVKDRGLRAVVLRPGRIFGPGTTLLTPEVGRRLGKWIVVLGDGRHQLPMVYVDDVIDAIFQAADKGGSNGDIYHLVDRAPITQNELARICAQQMPDPPRIVHVPIALLYAFGVGFEVLSRLLRRPMPLSIYRIRSGVARMHFDCTRAEIQIGWQPAVGTSAGLEKITTAKSIAAPAVQTIQAESQPVTAKL